MDGMVQNGIVVAAAPDPAEDQLFMEQRKAVVSDLIAMRNRWMEHRKSTGVEGRWAEATALYFGLDAPDVSDMEDLLTNGPRRPSQRVKSQVVRSRVVINIVRPKVDQAVARFSEIMLPLDGMNFGLEPTPVPDGVQNMSGKASPTIDHNTGQPTGLTADDEYKAIVAATAESVAKHEDVIADQLSECAYNGQLRIGIEDYVRLGTMIIEGPLPRMKTKRRWQVGQGGESIRIEEEGLLPVAERRDPWDVWFDPAAGSDHRRGAGYWVRHLVTKRQLRQLKGQFGYSEADIDAVIKMGPQKRLVDGRAKARVGKDESFEMFVYHGEIDDGIYSKVSLERDDPDGCVCSGVFMLCNEHLIGAMPSWCEDGEMPIHVACWRKTDDTPYGIGLANEQRSQQSVVNSSWRMLMDGAAQTIGDQLVIKRDGLESATPGGHVIGRGIGVWYASEKIQDVRQAFQVFSFPSHLGEHLNIVKAAMEYAEIESNMPQLMGGSGGGNAHETLGGMEMLFNNATVSLRHRVRTIDDDITFPLITGFYDFNMEFHDDPSIKAEAVIQPRGSSVLLEKDIQNKLTMQLAGVLQNPKYALYIDPEKELDIVLRALKVRPEQVKASPDEIKQRQQQAAQNPAPPDPKIVSLQMQRELKQMDIQDRQAQREFEMQRNAKDNQIRSESLQYNRAREAQEYELGLTDLSLKRDLALMKLQTDADLSKAGIVAKERLQAMKIDSENARFNAEAALRVRTGAGI